MSECVGAVGALILFFGGAAFGLTIGWVFGCNWTSPTLPVQHEKEDVK